KGVLKEHIAHHMALGIGAPRDRYLQSRIRIRIKGRRSNREICGRDAGTVQIEIAAAHARETRHREEPPALAQMRRKPNSRDPRVPPRRPARREPINVLADFVVLKKPGVNHNDAPDIVDPYRTAS